MNILYSVKIALRALAVNKGRTSLTALGIIIGVAAVITMVSLGQGLGNSITSEINAAGANWVYIMPGKEAFGPMGNFSKGKMSTGDVEEISRIYPATVKTVAPVVAGQGVAKYGNKSTSAYIFGGTEAYLRLENLKIDKGSFYGQSDIDGRVKTVVLGTTVVDSLTGSKHTDMVGRTVTINRQAFRVRGVLKSKGISFGVDPDNVLLMPYTTAMRRVLNQEDISYASVQAVSESLVPLVEEQIKSTLRRRHSIRPPYDENDDFSVITQESARSMVGNVTAIISILLGSIAAISLLVGSIGIMNIMLVSVTERTREIGLRKAVGATTADIMAQFLVEAVAVSLFGGLIGIATGLAGSWAAAYMINTYSSISVENVVNVSSILLAFGVSGTIGIAAGIYPARRAALMDPIAALRYE